MRRADARLVEVALEVGADDEAVYPSRFLWETMAAEGFSGVQFLNLTRGLVARCCSDEDIAKILGGELAAAVRDREGRCVSVSRIERTCGAALRLS